MTAPSDMTGPEGIAVLRLVSARLDDAALVYMLSGSLAMSYYAEPRMTRDIDIVVELDVADADRVTALFEDQFHCDIDVRRDAIRRQAMFNLIHTELVVKVDLIVRRDSPYRRTEIGRRRRVQLSDFETWIVAPEDLILSKLVWAKPGRSELQMTDARNLAATVEKLDWSYLERWSVELEVGDLLSEVRA